MKTKYKNLALFASGLMVLPSLMAQETISGDFDTSWTFEEPITATGDINLIDGSAAWTGGALNFDGEYAVLDMANFKVNFPGGTARRVKALSFANGASLENLGGDINVFATGVNSTSSFVLDNTVIDINKRSDSNGPTNYGIIVTSSGSSAAVPEEKPIAELVLKNSSTLTTSYLSISSSVRAGYNESRAVLSGASKLIVEGETSLVNGLSNMYGEKNHTLIVSEGSSLQTNSLRVERFLNVESTSSLVDVNMKVYGAGSNVHVNENVTLGGNRALDPSKSRITFGNFDGENFVAADAGAMVVDGDFSITYTSGSIEFLLGSENLNQDSAILQIGGAFSGGASELGSNLIIDLTNVVLDSSSDSYTINLITAASGLNESLFNIEILGNDDNSWILEWAADGTSLGISYVAVPEPATFAAVLGLSALLFAKLKRRKLLRA